MGYEEVLLESSNLDLLLLRAVYPDISAPHIRSNGWGTSLMSAMHVAALPLAGQGSDGYSASGIRRL